MANEESITEIVSPKAIKQVDDLTTSITKSNLAIQDAIVSARSLNETLSKSKTLGDFSKNAAAQAKAQEDVAKKTAQTQLAEERLAAFRANQQAKQDAAEAKRAAIEAKQIAADEARLKRIAMIEANALAAAQKEIQAQKDLASATRDSNEQAAMSANAATASVGKNTKEVNKNVISKKQQTLAEAQAKAAAQANTLALKNQAKELNAAKGSLDQRAAALARLQKAFAALNEEERNTPYGQRLAKVIPQLNAQVLGLEQSIGKSQRNVGNYVKGIGTFFNGALSGVRTLANIIPGLGIGGIFLAGYEGIKAIVDALNEFETTAKDAKVMATQLGASLSSTEYKSAVENISELRSNIKLAKDGFLDKDRVVKQYNETIGRTTGFVTNLNDAEASLNKNAAAYIKFTLLKTAANLSFEEAAQKAVEEAKARRQSTRSEDLDADSEYNFITRLQAAFEQSDDALVKSKNKKVKTADEQKNQLLKIGDDFNKQAAVLASRSGFDYFGDKQVKPKSNSAAESAARRSASALIQIQIDALDEAKKIYDEQQNQENFSLDARLSGLDNYQKTSLEIIKLQGDKEKAAKKLTANEILAIDSETKKKEQELDASGFNKRNEILKQSLARTKGIIAEQAVKDLTELENQRDAELAVLVERYNKGGMSEQTFADKRLAIEQKYSLLYIKLQLEQTEAFIKAAQLRGEDVGDAEAKLAALRIKYQDAVSANAKTNSDNIIAQGEKEEAERKAQAERVRDSVIELSQQAFEFTKELVSAQFTNQLNGVQAQKDSLDKKTQNDIENVNDSIATEQEKADRISIINARAAAEQNILDQKQREIKTKQAKADKAAAIASIIINYAVGYSKNIGLLGFLGLPLNAILAASAAIQIATVLATPIPQFEKGGTVKKDGMIITGEAGTELRIDPSGKQSLTDSSANLSYAKAGTKIIPNHELIKMMAKPDSKQFVGGQSVDISKLVEEQRNTTSVLKKAFGDKTVNSTLITKHGWYSREQKMSSIKKHINRNFN